MAIYVEDAISRGEYNHVQSSASAVWTINHNLGYYPLVDLFTTGGVQMLGRVTNLSLNTVQVNFNNPIAGKARLV